jgi:hypothetical protein
MDPLTPTLPILEALASFLEASNLMSLTAVASQNEIVAATGRTQAAAGRFREMISTRGYDGHPLTIAAVLADRFPSFSAAFLDTAGLIPAAGAWSQMSDILQEIEEQSTGEEAAARKVLEMEQALIARREGHMYMIRYTILQVWHLLARAYPV